MPPSRLASALSFEASRPTATTTAPRRSKLAQTRAPVCPVAPYTTTGWEKVAEASAFSGFSQVDMLLRRAAARGPGPHRRSQLFGRLSDALMGVAGRAVQIVEWDRTHQFCGACGGETLPHDKARARVCPRCKLEAYPRIAPAMIVLVERGEEVLLARSPHFPPGIYGALAGFVDAGESAEEAVHREVHEETGVLVKNVRYFGSQPWPFPTR
jgi:NADH pyrophosphatase NudC (nudix superfamily)